ncbi:MAG TPA: DUF554 domain-containing protein [Anaerolineales bacterium]|nr:DUF554 domain-containing protein [Anaerolineales bacterium]
MTGTIINVIAVLMGGTIGLFFGSRIPERFKNTIIAGLGLFTAAMGLQMFLKSENPLIVLGALLIGALLGEWWKIEDGLQSLGQTLEKRFSKESETGSGSRFVRGFMVASLLFCVGPMTILGSIQDGLTGDYNLLAVKSTLDGFASIAFASTLGIGVLFSSLLIGALLGEWWKIEDGLQSLGQTLEKRFSKESETGSGSRFVRGFMVASLLFCVGPMTILGSIQDGLTGDYNLLAVKSTLDGFASIAFASTLGIGVLFSSLVVLFFQGGISLMAGLLSSIISDPMMNEMTATGGVILLGLAVSNLLEIKKIRVGNFLPALAIAPLIVWVLGKF